jgi:hypothetical protein
MNYLEDKERNDIIKWLNTEVTENSIIFDCILNIKDEIIAEINNNKLELRYNDKTFLINLVYFLYYNSYTKIIN